MEIKKLLTRVTEIANKGSWEFVEFQENIGMVSFKKNGKRINIYLTKMTVATCINHPKHGKTQLFRKNCTIEEIIKIFNNPRIHTQKGYREKS